MSSRRDLVGALSSLMRLIDSGDNLDALRNGMVMANARAILSRAERGLIESPPWTAFVERRAQAPTMTQISSIMRQSNCTEAEARAFFAEQTQGRVFANSRYQVLVRQQDAISVHLSIKRLDQLPIHDWRDLQRCKDELVGPECEAVELYPAQSRLMDAANQYHLWAVADPEFRFPIGIKESQTSDADAANAAGAGQRPMPP